MVKVKVRAVGEAAAEPPQRKHKRKELSSEGKEGRGEEERSPQKRKHVRIKSHTMEPEHQHRMPPESHHAETGEDEELFWKERKRLLAEKDGHLSMAELGHLGGIRGGTLTIQPHDP